MWYACLPKRLGTQPLVSNTSDSGRRVQPHGIFGGWAHVLPLGASRTLLPVPNLLGQRVEEAYPKYDLSEPTPQEGHSSALPSQTALPTSSNEVDRSLRLQSNAPIHRHSRKNKIRRNETHRRCVGNVGKSVNLQQGDYAYERNRNYRS